MSESTKDAMMLFLGAIFGSGLTCFVIGMFFGHYNCTFN